ncbi:unnamed protein product [Durusdinium trenchii]|uniref:Fibronectin type-III domain-containing protein n=1 Tax=Durusdinium trenchii TaxID=1381693 RepID=A0ABP0LQ18_9DINO
MDFISPLPVSVGELRQRILSRWCTLEEAVQVAQLPDRLTYFEMRRFLCEDASALQGPSSPEPVALALLSVPEECELPVTQPSRLEAGILKVFIKLCKDEQVDPAQCNASVSRQGLLFELSRFAAREGFRSWSSRALLTGEGAPVDSDLSEDAFCEVVVRQNGHLEDAQEWFDLLCPSTSTAKPSQAPAKLLEPAALTQQALSWPKLPGALDASEPWQLSELVVRLVSVWGDLTAAFGLDAVKEEEASTRGASPARASKDGVKSMAVQPAAPAVRRRRRLTTRQWLRALRGKPGRLLLSEMEARTESERLALLPHTVDRLFSNLSDRLLVTKNLWLPDELIPVRYSLSELGFWGCGGPAPLAVGRKLPLGRRPFITFVPSQPELAGFEDSTHPSRALVSPHVASGVAWLRAPKPPNGAELVSWHLQLFSSEDGVTPLVSVSQPLLIQVMSVPPAPPSEIILCDQTPDSLTLSWTESLQDGGLEVLHYELSLELEDAISINHADEPPVTITELEPEKTYVCCVRAINSLGAGPWSATWSFKTADPCAPPALRAPYVVQVGTSQAFLRWVPVGGFRVSKYLMKALKAVSATGPENADGVIQMCEGDQMDMLFTDLSSFTPYQFCIAACNSQGQGPWSNLTPEVFTEPDLPGQAEDVACVAERASLCVTWKPPKDEGGASVLEYMLRVKSMELDNPQVLEMSVGNSPAWISGLFGNCSYRISVAARNAAGLGCFVDVEGRTAVVPPNAPRALELFCAEADAVIVRWLPPGNDGGSPVLNYVVKDNHIFEKLLQTRFLRGARSY